MQEKKSKDDYGDAWRKRRVDFCRMHQSKSSLQWSNFVQAIGDFKLFTYYPRGMKARHKVKNCKRTIMSKRERNRPAFLQPTHHIFTRTEHKRASKAKIFGITTSNGHCLVLPCPLDPSAKDWIKLVQKHIGGFLRAAFPERHTCQVLLDGESLLHTVQAKAALKAEGVRVLPAWPSRSPDLNPQENVWAWVEDRLRKVEKKQDTFSVFKRRIVELAKAYPNKEALIPSMAKRVAKCIRRKGANIGK